ncbi:MAG: hypothetical protein IKD79_04475, partial [Oscillospiraceae bacterium]|nr:hypothetical protein [Oscillospiraceae bacterium]
MEYLHILIDRTGDMTEFLWAMEREGLVGEHKFMMLLPKITIMKKRTEFLQFPYIEFWENSTGRFKKYRTKKRMIRRLNQ